MNWRRTGVIFLHDLRHGVLKAGGLVFLVPFLLFWYSVIRSFNENVSAWLAGKDGVLVMSLLFDPETAAALFVGHPPLLSAFFLLALSTAPLFAMLGAHDQFASAIGSGYFRYLCHRCTRFELFMARYLAALSFLLIAHGVVGGLAVWVSVFQDGFPFGDVLGYLGQILLTLLLYLAPFVAYMALVSAFSRSAVAALVLGMVGYLLLLGLIAIGNRIMPVGQLHYLLPSALKYRVLGMEAVESIAAIAALPLYTLAYGWAAWAVFRLRNF